MALGGNEKVAPEPDACDTHAPPKDGAEDGAPRRHRTWVTLSFADLSDVNKSGSFKAEEEKTTRISIRDAIRPENKDLRVGDICIRRYRCFYSAYTRSSNGKIDEEMEVKFAREKYVHFRGALIQWSCLMPIGVLALALNAGMQEHYTRLAVLLGGVAPLYVGYGIFAMKREGQYLHVSGTRAELCLIGCLCLHSALIVLSEWVRPELDYGMLAMHIGFVHNFTPLSAGAMQVVTALFGLCPYTILRIVRSAEGISSVSDTRVQFSEECAEPNIDETLTLGILTPIVVFIYQCVVTMGRDESLRIDALTGELLERQEILLYEEEQKNQGMLSSMLPRTLISALKANEHIEPQFYDDVTVIFIEICNFSKMCLVLPPNTVVQVLNIIYHEFDRLSDLLSVYKVETVGQVYMAVVGAPEPIVNHADVAAHFALAAQESMLRMKANLDSIILKAPVHTIPSNGSSSPTTIRAAALAARDVLQAPAIELPGKEDSGALRVADMSSSGSKLTNSAQIFPLNELDSDLTIRIRVGLNSGQIRAGVVGIDSPRFKLFGDTVNTASRMESTCEPGKVQVSPSTLQRLTVDLFKLTDRGEIPVKGKGKMRTSFLDGYRAGDHAPGERRIMIERNENGRMTSMADMERVLSEAPHWKRSRTMSREFKTTTSEKSGMSGGRVTPINSRLAGLRPSPGSKETPLGNPLDFVQQALAREEDMDMRPMTPAVVELEQVTFADRCRGALNRLETIFLLMPAEQKTPEWMAELRWDRPLYLETNLHKQIDFAKTLTMILLLVISSLTTIDFFLEPYTVGREEGLGEFRVYSMTLLLRAIGGNASGLMYLLALSSPVISRRFAQNMTILMLMCQGATMLLAYFYLYKSEPLMIGMVAMYGAFTLFYTVCTILQRILLCSFAVIGYVVMHILNCGTGGLVDASQNIAFLIVFAICMCSGVQLQEHLMHVSHYEQRTAQQRLQRTKQAKTAGATLLNNLLPQHVIPLVRDGVSPIAEHHSDVTIIFTDIKGFTDYSSRVSPHKLFTVLNSMYSSFDEIISNWALHKVEIIGDAYFVSAGCPERNSKDKRHHTQERTDPSEWAMRAVEVALALLRTLPTVCDDSGVQMRVGLHTGPVVAGVVGKKGPRYHLFGAAVGYAEQMESSGIPGRVQISDSTRQILEVGGHAYDFEERNIEVEGEDGLQRTWLVNKSNSKEAIAIQKRLMVQRRNWQQSEASDEPDK